MKYDTFMVFDVESIGLHGEAFAVAYVVVTKKGRVLEEDTFSCSRLLVEGDEIDRAWADDHIPNLTVTHGSVKGVRQAFWKRWIYWKDAGAALVADCGWPVEAKFLESCVQDDLKERAWLGPYPLLDLGSVLFANGKDPLGEYPRIASELPSHHPLMDARQSARLLTSLI